MTMLMDPTSVDVSLIEGEHFILYDVDWHFYTGVLRRLGNRRVFVTYDGETLELMSPSYEHDDAARLIGLLVHFLADELEVPLKGIRSTTISRKGLRRGLEADEAFYTTNEPAIRGKRKLDFAKVPPPDLAIEVEISRRLASRVNIYAALKVPEVWRYDGKRLIVLVLKSDGAYIEATASPTFPSLPITEVHRLLCLAREMDETAWGRTVRQWIREKLAR